MTRVEQVAAGDELDRVGDDLARDEARLHPAGAHRDHTRDRDRVELHRRRAGLADALLDLGGERAQVELHGIVSIHVLATPMIGLAIASSSKPMPFR